MLHTELARLSFRVNAIGPIANHDENTRHFLLHAREHADDVAHPLHWSEVRDVHEDAIVSRELITERRAILAAVVDRWINEVRNHLDLASRAAKCAYGFPLEETRHGGQPV